MKKSEPLNPQQQAAVNHVDGPLLVIAGAGSGKTRIVTQRIAHLLEIGVPASEIVAVTFTNKAAEEMRQRILQLSQQAVLTCTFHSLCARILRESIIALGFKRDFVIFDEDDSEKTLKECFAILGQKEDKALLKTSKSQISNAKNHLLEPDTLSQENELLGTLYKLYQNKLKEYNALDFDDLLILTVRLFREHADVLQTYQQRWSFILIDEYQDTNTAQDAIVKLLASMHHNVFAVGDPDQSIYSWRGANVNNILHFEKDYPGAKVISLEQNYRSRNTILHAANALIEHNTSRYQKNLWSALGQGEKIGFYICENEHAEADFVIKRLRIHHDEGIPLSECVIFYRTNFQSRVFEDVLLKRQIPYVIVGGLSFYQRKEIKDLLAFLRMLLSGSDFLSFARTINLPKRGLGESTLAKLRAFAEENGLDIFTACQKIVQKTLPFKLSQKQLEGLQEYVDMISALRQMVQAGCSLKDILSSLIERSRYLEYLKEEPESFQEKRENVEELVTKAAEWQADGQPSSLSTFLEELSLKSSTDDKETTRDALRLMTIHNGKGLEFAVVFLVGMEEELFPHANARESAESLEEERRLCYVGMTRAKEYLYLTASRYRFLWGAPRIMRPSRFLSEIPKEDLTAYHATFSSIHSETASDYEGDEKAFEMDDVVFHKDFGTGIIKRAYHTSMGLTYDVFFPKTGTLRTLVAKYAKLIKSDAF